MRRAVPRSARLSIGQCASLACLLEAAAPKVGNVHRGADFADMTFVDLAVSGVAIAPALDGAAARGVGATVLAAVEATRAVAPVNTNLGMVLLLAPLAAAATSDSPLPSALAETLARLTPADARDVYAAIRLAQPGGLGEVAEMDVAAAAPADLLAAMRAAADRDLVARQYAGGFRDVFELATPTLLAVRDAAGSLTEAIVHTHLVLIAELGDSLIARKCGAAVAAQAQARARRALDAGPPTTENYLQELAEFDFWLRSDGHRRNPGAAADLVAAALFVALHEGRLAPPFR